MTTPDFPAGSLEKLDISVETPIDDNVLTENAARNVRFRSVKVPGVTKGLGYSFSEVDKFVQEIVIPSLRWYQRTLHKRDQEVYTLGEALDELENVKLGLEQQIKSFEYNSTIREGLTAYKEDKEFQTLLAQNRMLEAELEKLKTSPTTNDTNDTEVPPGVDLQEYIDAIEERDQYISSLTEEYNTLQSQNAEILAQIADLENQVKEQPVAAENIISPEEVDALNSRILELEANAESNMVKLSEYEAHINAITEQYNELSTAYVAVEQAAQRVSEYETTIQRLEKTVADKNNVEIELATALAEISVLQNQYNELMAKPPEEDTTKIQSLEQELETLKAEYAVLVQSYQELQGTVNRVPDEDKELERLRTMASEYETYATAVTDSYNQLMEAYQEMEAQVNALQNSTQESTSSDGSQPVISEKELQELYTYIETISEQYSALLEAYNGLAQNSSSSSNNAEVGELRVELEASRAEVARLQELLDEYESEEVEEERILPAIPLLTDKQPNNVPLPPQFSNLPPGIRPEDLV